MSILQQLKNRMILQGDVLENNLPRDSRGRFIKGICYNLEKRFKKYKHWRKVQPYWNKMWLLTEYNKGKTLSEIAKEQNTTENNIGYFIKKFKIKTRTMSEIRSKKYWGLSGKLNGMYGKNGKLNPNWNGGHSPERQTSYSRTLWKELKKLVLKRDNYQCQVCLMNINLVVHHILPWSRYPELRFTDNNLMTVCVPCHKKIHGKKGGERILV